MTPVIDSSHDKSSELAPRRSAKDDTTPDERAREVLSELRIATAEVLAAIPSRPTRAIEVARDLGVDRSLGWKLQRVAFGDDALPSPQHVPGVRGLRIFLEAVEAAGVPQERVQRVARAFEAFRGVITELGGDRATGDIMLSEFSAEGRRRRDLALHRALYRANSQLLGIQAKRMRQITLAVPGASGHSPTYFQARGVFGFRCLREGAAWTFGRVMVVTEHDLGPLVGELRTPLEPADAGGAPLIRRFCRGEGELARRRTVAPGVSEDEIVPAPIGRAAARDIVLGERIGSVAADLRGDAVTTNVVMPMERLTVDLLLHRDLAGGAKPTVAVYTTALDPTPWMNRTERDRLPIETTVEPFTLRPRRGRRDLPLEYLLVAADANPSHFDAHRLELRFPPMPCMIVMSFPITGI